MLEYAIDLANLSIALERVGVISGIPSATLQSKLQDVAELINEEPQVPLLNNHLEDALVKWERITPELVKLCLYRYLNHLGYRMATIDSQIVAAKRKRVKKQREWYSGIAD